MDVIKTIYISYLVITIIVFIFKLRRDIKFVREFGGKITVLDLMELFCGSILWILYGVIIIDKICDKLDKIAIIERRKKWQK